MLRETFAIMIWAFQELGTLRVELVFDPDIVESFVARNNGGRSISSQRNTRRALTRIGRIVNPQSWPGPTESSEVPTGAAACACGCQNRTGQGPVLFWVLLLRLLIGFVSPAHDKDGYTNSTHHHETNYSVTQVIVLPPTMTAPAEPKPPTLILEDFDDRYTACDATEVHPRSGCMHFDYGVNNERAFGGRFGAHKGPATSTDCSNSASTKSDTPKPDGSRLKRNVSRC